MQKKKDRLRRAETDRQQGENKSKKTETDEHEVTGEKHHARKRKWAVE